MYDPNNDKELQLRKIAKQLQEQQKKAMSEMDMGVTIPKVEVAVAPPEMPDTNIMDQVSPYLDRLSQGAANYTGQGFGNPNVPPVQRGGGMLMPAQMPMPAYGEGLNSSGILDSIVKQQHGGVPGFVEDNADAFKELKDKIAKAIAGGA